MLRLVEVIAASFGCVPRSFCGHCLGDFSSLANARTIRSIITVKSVELGIANKAKSTQSLFFFTRGLLLILFEYYLL